MRHRGYFILFILAFALSNCKIPQKEHFVVNENDTIASLIERNDSLIKIDVGKYDFKDKELNRQIVDFFEVDDNVYICVKDSYERDKFSGRHSRDRNGYKLILTEKLDTIAYLAFNDFDVGAYVKTSVEFENISFQRQIMDIFGIKNCDFYVMKGNGIVNMNIYSSVDLYNVENLGKNENLTDSYVETNELIEDEICEDDSIVIPLMPRVGLKNISCTLDYLYFILREALSQDYSEETDALYCAIALRDIGEFAIKCMISSNENVRKKANDIISFLDEHQSSMLEHIRFKLYFYYFQNMKYYDLNNVEKTESKLNSKGDKLYSLYLHSNKFINEDYCRRVFDYRDNIIGYAGFNRVYFVGPNGQYTFPIYPGQDLKPDQIGWSSEYMNYKSKSIDDILEDIERFYNPF